MLKCSFCKNEATMEIVTRIDIEETEPPSHTHPIKYYSPVCLTCKDSINWKDWSYLYFKLDPRPLKTE